MEATPHTDSITHNGTVEHVNSGSESPKKYPVRHLHLLPSAELHISLGQACLDYRVRTGNAISINKFTSCALRFFLAQPLEIIDNVIARKGA